MTIPFATMENTNPPLSPEEVIVLRDQIKSEIRELRELNRLIDIELDSALNDLAIAMYSNKSLGPDDFAVVEVIEEQRDGELNHEYFNLYPTKEEIAYYSNIVDNPRPPFVKIDPKIKEGNPWIVKIPCMIGYKYINQAYIDCESPINVMSSSVYNDIMSAQLEPRRDPKLPGEVCNFVGRIKNVHIFVGSFIYVTDFMILEDLASVIDYRLSHVVLGKPFVESKLRYNRLDDTVQFSTENDKVTYRMPNRMKEFRYVPQLDKDNISAFEDINEEDRKKGMDYVWEKKELFL